jgi:hypothetical protein
MAAMNRRAQPAHEPIRPQKEFPIMKKRLGIVALAGALLLSAAPVPTNADFYVIAGGGVGTAITSLPYTITQPGFYYLKSNHYFDFTTPIRIEADDVTLDFMGFCLSGAGLMDGVYISLNSRNVEVRNGTVRNFYNGIHAHGVGNRILKMTTRDNTSSGILFGYGSGGSITGCHSYNNGDYGYKLDSNGIFLGNVAYNNGYGFCLTESPQQLVDGNSSYGNTVGNWRRFVGCTAGINTP